MIILIVLILNILFIFYVFLVIKFLIVWVSVLSFVVVVRFLGSVYINLVFIIVIDGILLGFI